MRKERFLSNSIVDNLGKAKAIGQNFVGSGLDRLRVGTQDLLDNGLRFGFEHYNGFQVIMDPTFPREGKALILTSHFSLLDVPALFVTDPFPNRARFALKKDMYYNPLLWAFVRLFNAFPVDRDGRDIKALRTILRSFQQNHSVCLAAEGTRSRNGHLQPIDDMVVGTVIMAIQNGVPVAPIAIVGSYESLPAGKIIPKRTKMIGSGGPEIDFSDLIKPGISRKSIAPDTTLAIAHRVRNSIAALLPPENQPLPGTPDMWTKADYMKK